MTRAPSGVVVGETGWRAAPVILTHVLDSLGFHVRRVASPEEAAKLAAEDEVDLIIDLEGDPKALDAAASQGGTVVVSVAADGAAGDGAVLRVPHEVLDARIWQIGRVARDMAASRQRLHEIAGATPAAESDLAVLGLKLGCGACSRELEARVREHGASAQPLRITGPRGAGKKTIARAIHATSPRAAGPFVVLAPEEVTDETLAKAHGGTLVLDRASEVPEATLERIVKAIEERRLVRPDGRVAVLDARLIALDRAEDGAAPLRGLAVLHLAPLAARIGEVPGLAEDLIQAAATRLGQPVPELALDALELIMGYGWPENVRELRSACETAVSAAGGAATLRASHFPVALDGATGVATETGKRLSDTLERLERVLLVRALRESRGRLERASTLLGVPPRTLRRKLKHHGLRGSAFREGRGSDERTPTRRSA
jgi:DNA-binding NtrC family response regulator